ncbi:3-methyl-2-oxobutanoate hydroxymethyltransferase [Serratia marcescens]|uniref:3-methyl-2-oxobutanoate hydroxymethyltransferase n=1 Tax=Serratia marcescens TaxID=615 RepID=A0A939NPW6_SERMA|nr:3-methyl-2-oxobutanoate hydroxymethyltransferase [Serratia marcescens]
MCDETHHRDPLAPVETGAAQVCYLTAYDASFAKLFEEQGIKVLLVGASLGMTLQPRLHAAGHRRRRGLPHSRRAPRHAGLLLADLPFMSYATPEQTFANAAELMRAGANMVKLEKAAAGCATR